MKSVSIIIPVLNQTKMTVDCLADLTLTTGVKTQVILIDDGSKENVTGIVAKLFPFVKIVKNNQNMGFSKSINRGIKEAKHDLILLLNNDIRLPNPNWLKIMVNETENADLVGVAGGRMDANWNYLPGEAKSNKEDYAYLAFWCALIKKEVFNKIGLLSEDFPTFWQDCYFCYQAKQHGFKMSIVENTKVTHLYHATFKTEGYNLNSEYQKGRQIFLNLIGK